MPVPRFFPRLRRSDTGKWKWEMARTQDILDLLDKGFVPYSCKVPLSYYQKKRCGKKDKAEWFTRPRQKTGEPVRYICLGCKRRCAAVNPSGWTELLDMRGEARLAVVAYTQVERISVDDMLRLKRVLRVEEAAWALNVGARKIRDWIDEGLLEPVPGRPVRVTCRSVSRVLQPD